jgi:hypothetical protein
MGLRLVKKLMDKVEVEYTIRKYLAIYKGIHRATV